jgi:hypothetical protein
MRFLQSAAFSTVRAVAARYASLTAHRVTAAPRSSPDATRPSGGSFEIRRAGARRAVIVVALIAVGATSGFHFLGVTLTLLNAVCLLLAPALLIWRPTLGQWLPLALAVIGFAAFFVSSRTNHLSLADPRVLQWPSFAIYYVGFLVLAGRDVERVCSLLCGLGIGSTIYFLQPGKLPPGGAIADFQANQVIGFAAIWKYAFGQWTGIILLFLLIVLRAAVPLQALFLFLLGAFSLVNDFRSHATNCILAALILLTGWLFAGKITRWLQLTIVAVFAMVAYPLVLKIATSGLAGDAVRHKTTEQTGTGVPLILAGRTESPLSVSAILDRPWLGWGSANNISPEVVHRAAKLAISLGFDPAKPFEATWYTEQGDVSLHSVLFAAWAEGGVFAALLPLGLVLGSVAMIFNAPRYGRWTALAIYVAVQGVWDLLFSPFGYNVLPGYAILAVLFAARHLPSEVGAEVPGAAGLFPAGFSSAGLVDPEHPGRRRLSQ